MNKIAIFITLLALPLLIFSVPTEKNDSREETYFILHYEPGPSWDHEKPANEQVWFTEHSQFLSSLRGSGRAKIGGRYSDKGMIIFTARDHTQADSLLSTDPSVTHETFTAELHSIRFFLQGFHT
jgi:hypothetical protein